MIMEAVAEKRQQKVESMDIESPAEDYLLQLSRKLSQDMFTQKVQTLTKIFTNIRENLIDEKFRTLKKSNKNIAQLS